MQFFRRNGPGRAPEILVVCTGNVCRSPFIAGLMAVELPDLRISSAGTGALVGQPPVVEVQQMLADRGAGVGGAVSRGLTRGMVRSSRLIVTATRFHRARVVALDPTAAERAFTLKELARLIGDAPVAGLSAVTSRAAAAVQVPERSDFDDDLADPVGLEWPAFERLAAEVDVALSVIVPALRHPDHD